MIIGWAGASLGLFVASRVLAGVRLRSFADALWAGALLGILHWALHGVIFVLLGIATLGIGFLLFFITTWVASAIVVLITAKLSARFDVDGFINAVVTALIVSAAGVFVRWLI
jgi:uncharacterized membrane protein YvlD (DUF360 family)